VDPGVRSAGHEGGQGPVVGVHGSVTDIVRIVLEQEERFPELGWKRGGHDRRQGGDGPDEIKPRSGRHAGKPSPAVPQHPEPFEIQDPMQEVVRIDIHLLELPIEKGHVFRPVDHVGKDHERMEQDGLIFHVRDQCAPVMVRGHHDETVACQVLALVPALKPVGTHPMTEKDDRVGCAGSVEIRIPECGGPDFTDLFKRFSHQVLQKEKDLLRHFPHAVVHGVDPAGVLPCGVPDRGGVCSKRVSVEVETFLVRVE